MFYKRPGAEQRDSADKAVGALPVKAEKITDIPVREYMLKWLSAFAGDISVADAKAFCLPRLLYQNYIWHAFSFRKTDCIYGDDAAMAARDGIPGECFILMCDAQALYKIPDGSVLTPQVTESLGNAVVFDTKFTKTYVHTGEDGTGPFYKEAEA